MEGLSRAGEQPQGQQPKVWVTGSPAGHSLCEHEACSQPAQGHCWRVPERSLSAAPYFKRSNVRFGEEGKWLPQDHAATPGLALVWKPDALTFSSVFYYKQQLINFKNRSLAPGNLENWGDAMS